VTEESSSNGDRPLLMSSDAASDSKLNSKIEDQSPDDQGSVGLESLDSKIKNEDDAVKMEDVKTTSNDNGVDDKESINKSIDTLSADNKSADNKPVDAQEIKQDNASSVDTNVESADKKPVESKEVVVEGVLADHDVVTSQQHAVK